MRVDQQGIVISTHSSGTAYLCALCGEAFLTALKDGDQGGHAEDSMQNFGGDLCL
jgi:2C-methyl-D-erythritol 2,4-cyclodiphosphate synthase